MCGGERDEEAILIYMQGMKNLASCGPEKAAVASVRLCATRGGCIDSQTLSVTLLYSILTCSVVSTLPR